MKTQVGDSVVLLNSKNRKLTVVVTNVDENQYKGVVDNKDRDNADLAETVDFDRHDIWANLGKTPKFGTVYGNEIEPWQKNKSIRPWASVSIHTDLNETDERLVLEGLKKCGQVCQQRGFIAPKPIDVEIRNPKGKYNGMYYYRPKEDVNDKLVLRLKNYEEGVGQLIYHEIGHHVWFNLMTKEQRNVWNAAFIKSSIIKEVTKADMKGYYDILVESGNCRAFLAKAEDDDEALVLNEIFKYIATRHKIDKRTIDELLEAEQHDQVQLIFPTHTTFVGKKDPLVSDYGATNVRELFSEAFSFHMSDIDMAKPMRILIKKTLKELV